MTPSSITTTYRHDGCCLEFAGAVVDLHAVVHPETGSYVPAPSPRCVIAHTDLLQVGVPRPTYGR